MHPSSIQLPSIAASTPTVAPAHPLSPCSFYATLGSVTKTKMTLYERLDVDAPMKIATVVRDYSDDASVDQLLALPLRLSISLKTSECLRRNDSNCSQSSQRSGFFALAAVADFAMRGLRIARPGDFFNNGSCAARARTRACAWRARRGRRGSFRTRAQCGGDT
jgi:hypothetical protein